MRSQIAHSRPSLTPGDSAPMPDPQLIRVKKYPNRRLYDGSRSRHLTHAELYDLVVAGHTVSVTDSRSGADITNLVLMQALIERSPDKFAAFPPEVAHLMIRASEQMLRGAANNWFLQFMRSMPALGLGGAAPFGFGGASPFAVAGGTAVGQASAPPIAPLDATEKSRAPSHGDDLAAMRSQLETMMKEIASLKRTRSGNPTSTPPRSLPRKPSRTPSRKSTRS